jgi:hypothetical protein
MVFFLGAGASRAAPAFLPQPPLIQRMAFESVAPKGAAVDLPIIEASLPEIYHEVLLDLGGEETRNIWLALSAWENAESAELSRFALGPNIVHLLVAYLSWRSNSPVVTVNFDEMLERAATGLGFDVETSPGRRAARDGVTVWKIHGSVDDLRSVRTTLQSITATDPGVLRAVEREFQRSTGCLIGYSGRDIDFFPFLCNWTDVGFVYWLALNLDATAIGRFGEIFLQVDAPAEAWARRVVEEMPVVDEPSRLLKSQLLQDPPPEGPVVRAYESEVRRLAKRTYGRSFPVGHPKRLLAHATALAALGRNKRAEEWLDRYLARGGSAELDCRAHILKSALAHEFARYEESREHARIARDLAEEHRFHEQADIARLRIVEANRMLHLPPRLPIAKGREVLRRQSLRTIIEMLVFAARSPKAPPGKGRAARNVGYANLRSQFEFLEHLVRVGAVWQGLLEQFLPGDTGNTLFARWWNYIERRSFAVGYTFGIGNAKKYRSRRVPVEDRNKAELSVLELYARAPSPTGSSIHYRDVADLAVAQAEKLRPGPAREARLREAVVEYEKAIEHARVAGDPSLELKAMFGLRTADGGRTWATDDIYDLLDRIQSPAWERLRGRIAVALSGL